MMFSFLKRFRKKKNKEKPQEHSEYAELARQDHKAVELCEQMIDTSRELESVRDEYRVVTAYLNDVQTLEDLPDSERAELIETATHIMNLDKLRDQLMETRNRISDVQFAQMQEAEDEIPKAVERLKSNETYLAAIERDLHTLEGEKLSWNIEKKEDLKEMKQLRNICTGLFVLLGTLLALYFVLNYVFEVYLTLPFVAAMFVIAAIGAFAIIRYQDCQRSVKQSELNINHAITLENHVKIKYVNMKNAVDYTCEKYHVNNSRELVFLYEQYQESVKERKKFRDANDDLVYYGEKLVRQLREYQLYDARIWTSYPAAICDKKEMVEVKHDLLVRRQKLRSQIEYNTTALTELKKQAENSLDQEEENRARIEEIIRKLDQINQTAI